MAFARTAISTTGNFTNGSTSITNVASTANMFVGMNIFGTRIQADTQITAISGTTVTMSKTATGTQTGGDITASFILQSGTDADPSGLSAMIGVTTITRGSGNTLRTIFDLGTNQLRFQGTITIDPDIFEIVSNVRGGLSFEAGSNITYGIARVVNGQTTYSKGTGLVSTFNGDYFTAFGITWSGGTFTWNGGVIRTFGAVSQGGANTFISNTYDSVWQCWGTDGQFRSSGTPTFNAITFQGVNANCVAFMNGGWNALAIKYERAFYQTPAGGNSLRTIINPVFTGNQSLSDLNANSGAASVVAVKNPDRFPNVIKMGAAIYADFPILETLSLNVTNSAGANASNVVTYIKDSNNGARINTATNTYIPDRTYIASSNVSGVASLGDILVAVFSNLNLTTTAVNIDYRSNYGNTSADFNVYLGGYEFNPAVTKQSLIGNGGKTVAWTMFNDLNVSLSRANALAKLASSFTINPTTKTITVTANSTYDDLYDIAKAWKYNGTQLNAETPTISDLVISASGSNLNAYTGWNLVVNNGVTLSEGTKFTKIKFDTVTINGAITGIYQTNSGTSTIWEFGSVAEPVLAGTSLAIYDNAGNTKYYNAVTTDGVYRYYIAPQAVGETYTYAIEKYGTRRESGTFPSNAGGILFYVPSYSEDVGITETNLAIVQAYTTITNSEQFFDYTAVYRLSETGIKKGNIVNRDGTNINITGFNHIIKNDATAIYSITGDTITTKGASYEGTTKYEKEVTDFSHTIEADTTEIITILIEDANGDSSAFLQGTANNLVEVWKIPNTTLPKDFETGVLLDTGIGNGAYRFISEDGFQLVFNNTDLGIVFRYCSMSKGDYRLGWYIYNEATGGLTDEQSLLLNNIYDKEIIIQNKLDTDLDVKVSTRLATIDYEAPHNIEIDAIKEKVDTLENTNLTGIATTTNVTDAKDEIIAELQNIDIDLTGVALEATSQEINGKVDDIKTKVLTLENYNDATAQAKLDAIKSKTDVLENTDLTGIATTQNVTDAQTAIETKIDNIVVDNEAIANEVWSQEPERLKQVATVETTGEQLASFNNA